MFNKKSIAREWLYFLLFFSIGLIIIPVLLRLIFSEMKLGEFYGCLIGEKDCFRAWFLVIAPYLLFQFIRSIIWARKQLKNENIKKPLSKDIVEENNKELYVPLKPKVRRGWGWGWGWGILTSLFIAGFVRQKFYDPAIWYITSILVIPILYVIYFGIRGKLIKKWVKEWELPDIKCHPSRWKASIVAGFISYTITLILCVIPSYLDKNKMWSDINVTKTRFQGEILDQKEKEVRFQQAFILEPKSDSDIKQNLKAIDEYLQLIDQKYTTANKVITELREIYKKAGRNEEVETLNNLQQLINRQFDLGEKSLEALKRHYKTGDENSFREYEKMMNELEILQKQIQDSISLVFQPS
jgi:hypothetical protein